ncbi:50S ribosomal protein L21 [Candidatus Roizmanbacteria bacterium RIFOXYB2_FULL_41_10]|uniref:Large ribosomal subunit protein bL21 n=1 Tax=Candidatus Roizmanbacteria bacterium RIFOXYA1_FULL_41_12 TaxID=1802082 RepID=A0A1F7K2C2_9BACT|nr:MAG: 50S ribosomal protein L21 [Candidatus Roizmanbacteria bacterium RIFOXYA1_FULL_41_12]OGK66499.1 MAG: 50S ribosomal protein L21 [Candidatus Roizmanbacteria bacterium RIFOXYA2_FULL_41_8]OGK66598.1 MAG: 50S ribosomal protein L21 [Candidatus Roizmanbacteria bacterium RIFOXYB1_FULL_41_27]OGK69264.1 MAG: 50S ribosomal protein L21 [Candidatus Roizmanbacteria bacterium RIFOXYB2_FULL_41_10]OGK70994.1 MAG: 50S ribosomal protein L21 [Candidatus Roizmanbacteria bacterium RIFOXYC1_FULL_41_16]OGK7461
MNKQAVIVTGGKQYLVEEKQILVVDRLNGKEKDEIKFEQVLLKTKGEDLELGAPFLDKAMVTAKILKQDQGEKIRVARFKAKSKYRKVTGHRTQLTQIEILKIV